MPLTILKRVTQRVNMKDIKGYEKLYAVDESGNVWSLRKNKVLKPRLRQKGYCAICLCKQGKVKDYLIHRLVADAYIGISAELEVNHINGNRSDNRLSNLECVSRSVNALHGKWINKNGNQKLTLDDAKAIRERASKGEKQIDIAKEFIVSPQTINQIIKGCIYKNTNFIKEYAL